MIQNFDVQLQVALRALQDVVAPALGNAEKHVIEQLMLAIVTIGFVKTRLPEARRFYRMELRSWIELAKDVSQIAQAPQALTEAITSGESALANVEADIADFDAISRSLRDGVTALSSASVGQSHHKQLQSLILRRCGDIIAQHRHWMVPFGFEQQAETLPKPAW